jgi:DNA-binding YbaB/EbfC family protein
MFKNLGNMAGLFKQAQEMQEKMTASQEKLEAIMVHGESGAGMVQVEMTAKGMVKSLTIDPSLMNPNDIEILQDLVMSAVNDAKQKADTATATEMEKVTGGLSLPAGFKLPF